jgi:hypothetical protein
MKRALVSCAILLAGSSSSTVWADHPYPYYGFGTYYAGATPYSTAAHGFADVVRSAGVYNLLTSEAAINWEKARKLAIDNRLHWTQTYFEMRRINREARRAAYLALNPPHTQEDFIRYAQADAPKRLSSSQLDPITGYLAWPRLLLRPEFAELRRDLEKLFALRATAGGAIGNEAYDQILYLVEIMQRKLQDSVGTVKGAAAANDYLQARKFLESLAHEARFPSG